MSGDPPWWVGKTAEPPGTMGAPAEVVAEAPLAQVWDGAAIWSLVLGILGVGCIPLAPVGLVLGVIGLIRVHGQPKGRRGRGLAIAGICLSMIGCFVTLPVVGHLRGLSLRAVCAANLRWIGQGLHIYSYDNAGWFPCSPFEEAAPADGNRNSIAFVGELSNLYSFPHRIRP